MAACSQDLPYFLRNSGPVACFDIFSVLPLDLDNLWEHPELSYLQCPCLVTGLLFLWRFFIQLYFLAPNNASYLHPADIISFVDSIWIHTFDTTFCLACLPKLVHLSNLIKSKFFPLCSTICWEEDRVRVVCFVSKAGCSSTQICPWRLEMGALLSGSLISLVVSPRKKGFRLPLQVTNLDNLLSLSDNCFSSILDFMGPLINRDFALLFSSPSLNPIFMCHYLGRSDSKSFGVGPNFFFPNSYLCSKIYPCFGGKKGGTHG